MSFVQFNLHPHISEAIKEQDYACPTPIQRQAIPHILSGRDVMGLAQTGTGKTAAFVLPLLQQLMPGQRRGVRALILSPTRELAAQTHDAIRALGRHTRVRSTVIFGGVNMNPQIEALKRGADIVVACPGRLLDHMNQRHIDLSALQTLIVDEADRMFDMGFLPDLRRIVRQIPSKRQTLLFSATMPDEIRHLAGDMLNNAVTVQVDHTKPVATIAHALYPVPQHLKTALLKTLLKRTVTDSVIVFTRTKHRAKRLAEQLSQSGFSATSLQGNLSQNQRQNAITGFRAGSYQILVATDIAARGIDVAAVSHVINYDMPDTADAYTHRIGRTGRVSRSGEAFTFVTAEDKAMILAIEQTLGEKIKRTTLSDFDYAKPQEKTDRTGQAFRQYPQPRTPKPVAGRKKYPVQRRSA
ncbi:MAG: DEAD/DEAH box helicase [Syntrophaceae bacterium]